MNDRKGGKNDRKMPISGDFDFCLLLLLGDSYGASTGRVGTHFSSDVHHSGCGSAIIQVLSFYTICFYHYFAFIALQ